MYSKLFESARNFVYRNARPLDFALWKYHFEGGSESDVLSALKEYQNDDGGFGHAIEPDMWNTNSTPISTWAATEKLNQINLTDKLHPIINGILKYLDSGKDFEDGKWLNTVPSNNDYPHAVWWGCNDAIGIPDDNPTVSLAGFAVKYADKNSSLYAKASEIIKMAVKRFIDNQNCDMHTVRCYMELYEYCRDAHVDFIDMAAFKATLFNAVRQSICADTSKWLTEYVCKPSFFFDKSWLLFEIIDLELCKKEAELLKELQQPDGSYPVTWQWHNDYKEFEISKNWWKSSIIINNILYLKALQ